MTKLENQRPARRLRLALRGRAGQVLYCALIALALTAIAFAAESYRSGRGTRAETAALPAVELAAPEATDAQEPPRAPEGAELVRAWTERPAWNGELGLWEAHPAVDYRIPGNEVACLCPGVVRAVGVSGALGGYVEVESGELLLRYASISPREGLQPGDALAAGEAVGFADASLPGECALGPHLHLEAYQDGEAVDYSALLPGD